MNQLEQLPIPLLQWFQEHARVLPWRSDPTPYHVWISEIMSQQTRVAAVLDYYRRFLDALPTVAHLAAVEEDTLLKLWQGLGYYNRARNLQKAARQIMEEFGGGLSRLLTRRSSPWPGWGDTAGAISSIAFGIPVPAVDGNVLRVVARITGDRGDILNAATKARMRAALLETMPKQFPGAYNQALHWSRAPACPTARPCVSSAPPLPSVPPIRRGSPASSRSRPPRRPAGWRNGPCFSSSTAAGWPSAAAPSGACWRDSGVPQRGGCRPRRPGGLGHHPLLSGSGGRGKAHLLPHRVAHACPVGRDGGRHHPRRLGVGRRAGAGGGLCHPQRLPGLLRRSGRPAEFLPLTSHRKGAAMNVTALTAAQRRYFNEGLTRSTPSAGRCSAPETGPGRAQYVGGPPLRSGAGPGQVPL